MAVYVPLYAFAYGFANFLFLCNLAVILVAVGIWTCSRLLLSSQAVGILLVGAVWTLDFASRLLTGSHLIGGTEYMWDPQWPLFTRLLSLYHVILPVLLVVVLPGSATTGAGTCFSRRSRSSGSSSGASSGQRPTSTTPSSTRS
jgi:uncharacterized membrane protein YgcG